MKLDREARHKSEDIADAVLLDAVKAIRRRVRVVNREYDIRYIAGCSVDGHTVFIDSISREAFAGLRKAFALNPFFSPTRSWRRPCLMNCACIISMRTRSRGPNATQ
jgi:hypothetical protein